jgi:monovalent cation/proton antiporter MnhG/PhaG subunit
MIILETLAAILKIIGVGFLVLAAVGVYRLKDPFMRMHAATKAGTLGAGLVALATALTATDWTTAVSGLATVAFLLMTLPVASHLLGRATYVSGAAFDGAGTRDALAGVLKRAPVPLEERLFAPPGVEIREEPAAAAPATPRADVADLFEATIRPKKIDQLLIAALDGMPATSVPRWQALGRAEGVEPTLVAFLDQALLEEAPDRQSRDGALVEERSRLADVVRRFETAAAGEAPGLAVQYAEGDPFALLARMASPGGLLVLPTDGWFSHGIALPVASYARTSDRLLAFADSYPGHVLFVPPEPRKVRRVIALDDGSTAFLANLSFAIDKALWGDAEIVVTGPGDPEAPTVRRLVIETVLNSTGARWRFPLPGESVADIAAHAEAACLHGLEKPLRTDWYGVFWQERVATGWRGELLVG